MTCVKLWTTFIRRRWRYGYAGEKANSRPPICAKRSTARPECTVSTALINDDDAVALVRDACSVDQCARKILWDISPELQLHLVREKTSSGGGRHRIDA